MSNQDFGDQIKGQLKRNADVTYKTMVIVSASCLVAGIAIGWLIWG